MTLKLQNAFAAVLLCLSPLGASAQTRTVTHEHEVQQETPAGGGMSTDAVNNHVLWSEELPEALQRVETDRLPPVDGPLRLRADPRGVIPEQPRSLQEFQERFFPTWRWARSPENIDLSPEQREHRVRWEPEAGVCYAAFAIDTALASFPDRKKESEEPLLWWEGGTDIDIQIRDADSQRLITEDLSRQLSPRAMWCSDGRPVTVDVRLGVPADAPEHVQVAWGIVVDEQSLAPLRFEGVADPLAQRLLWAQTIVAPKGRALSAPIWFDAVGATKVQGSVSAPEQGCEVLVAVGGAGILDVAIAMGDGRDALGDFATEGALAAVPLCRNAALGERIEFVVGVRQGIGRVALQRFSFGD